MIGAPKPRLYNGLYIPAARTLVQRCAEHHTAFLPFPTEDTHNLRCCKEFLRSLPLAAPWLATGKGFAVLHSGVNRKAGGPSAHCAVRLQTPGPPLCTSTMSLYLAWTLSRRAETVPASAMCLSPVTATSVPADRWARVSRSYLARTKSRASMAAGGRLPVRLVWLPRLRRQTSPFSVRALLGEGVAHA